MPFRADYEGPFTRHGIERVPSTAQGVYGLSKPGQWIYVGMGAIRDRLLSHLGGDNACITRNNPTLYVAEVTSGAAGREQQLIVELDPTCNRRVG